MRVTQALSLRSKLMITFIVVILIPAVAIGALSYESSKKSVKDQLIDSAQSSVQTADQILTQIIGSKVIDIDAYAKVFNFNQTADPETSGLLSSLGTYLDTHTEVQNIYIGTDTGTMIRGKLDASATADYDPRVRPWYKSAMAQPGKSVISAVSTDKNNKAVIFISKTLSDGRGVLGLSLDLSKLQEMTKTSIGKEGYIMIMDTAHQYVVHPSETLGKPVEAGFVTTLFASEQAHFDYMFNGSKKEMVFVTNELTGWKVAGTMYSSEVAAAAAPIRNTTAIVLVISILLFGAGALWIVHSLLRPLKRLGQYAEQISGGDLTLRVATDSSDEIGQLSRHFQHMVDNLHQMIVQIQEMTLNLSASSQQLTAGADQTIAAIEHVTTAIQEVAAGSEKQLTTIQTGSDKVSGISRGVAGISASLQELAKQSEAELKLTDDGSEAIGMSVMKMAGIQETVQELDAMIADLNERSENISAIISTISDIAGQTNLLALNASIEAARAGEHGRGFSVVATEVRKLAEMSSYSAQQISELVTAIQMKVSDSLQAMNTVKERVDEGMDSVDLSGRSFARIRRSVSKSSKQIDGVRAASSELEQDGQSVMAAMQQIAGISEEAAGNTQTVSAAAEEQLASIIEIGNSASELSRLAENLQKLVSRFKI
ncbi:methyl-accepting chemotaxis protein [Paenibacillus pinistramenti]|uniref:methyl-accepting chemotaxis protein n=1 Tax=Paenibacillus pinistramenti TaxID=1768003 RepID=UPI001109C24E|nr:methyl-accepting chemotaxis protein [Paenibacillus pinistramenti]